MGLYTGRRKEGKLHCMSEVSSGAEFKPMKAKDKNFAHLLVPTDSSQLLTTIEHKISIAKRDGCYVSFSPFYDLP